MDATVKCADCGWCVALYSDGRDVRVSFHDVCGMGGQKLEVNERAWRAARPPQPDTPETVAQKCDAAREVVKRFAEICFGSKERS